MPKASGVPLTAANRRRLIAAREALELSQSALAAKIGTDSQNVCRIESGAMRPSRETLRKIANTLRLVVSVDVKVTIRAK